MAAEMYSATITQTIKDNTMNTPTGRWFQSFRLHENSNGELIAYPILDPDVKVSDYRSVCMKCADDVRRSFGGRRQVDIEHVGGEMRIRVGVRRAL